MGLFVGTRVKLRRDVERYPHFIARVGITGVVSHADEDLLVVKADDLIDGAEPWDNEIEFFVGTDAIEDCLEEV